MSAMDIVPMLKLPSSWPLVVNATLAMATLAVIDVGAAYAAKEWVLHRAPAMLLLGAALMVLLFWVYASALQYADMAVVTLGWIVLIQLGVMILDTVKYDVDYSARTWAIVVGIMAAQGYLVISSSGS